MSDPHQPIEIFCSYAHEDEAHLQKLETHLSILKRQGLIATWYDRQITAGMEWAQAIDAHLNSASVILLLISPDFLASDYCYGIEMTRALERHKANEARVLPILLRPVDWRGAPFAHLQALPTNAKPVTSWSNRDEALADIAAGIRRAIEDLGQLSASSSRRDKPMKESEDAGKYQVNNNKTVQGQVIGDHATVHQHFYPTEDKATSSREKTPLELKCTVKKREELKHGFIYEFCLKNSNKEYILKLVVDYGWKNTLYLDGEKIFEKQIKLIDSVSLDIEVYLKLVRVFWCPFTIDGYNLEYSYFCKKWASRSTYTILIKTEKEVLFEKEGYY